MASQISVVEMRVPTPSEGVGISREYGTPSEGKMEGKRDVRLCGDMRIEISANPNVLCRFARGMIEHVRINSVRAWVLAARPKTLAGAAAPVIMGGGCAWMWLCGNAEVNMFNWWAFALCILFAWIMQVDANFVNDYFDFKKGGDTEQRLGPKRACAQGWITPRAMKTGIIVTTVLACAVGLPLIWIGGLWMIAVGAACVVFCFLYTTKFSRMGLGDLLVLVFFGIVPVGFTFFLQTGTWNLQATLAGLSCGLAVDCLLMVNNYRDRRDDVRSSRHCTEQAGMVRRPAAAVRSPAPSHIQTDKRHRRSRSQSIPGQNLPQFIPARTTICPRLRTLKTVQNLH